MRMARVRKCDAAGFRVDHGVEHGEEHLRARELIGERLLEPAQHFGRGLGRFRVDAGGRHHERHDERGAEAVARHVTDHHTEVLRRLEESLADELASTEMFLTVFYAVVDPKAGDRKSTRLNSSHLVISYAV